ncbi:unnamed protein product [Meloidogyne enterolobii]|uniref:Uncharacterized protein n=1 Tax=Meloidogyne enterolobii TaxID=390850 RepID=A0ACB1AIC8_MELEN
MGNNASVGGQRANVGNNSYEHNGYDSVPQRTNVGGAGLGNPANTAVDPLYTNNAQQPGCSYGNPANGYEFNKQAGFGYDNLPHNQNTQQPTFVTEYDQYNPPY